MEEISQTNPNPMCLEQSYGTMVNQLQIIIIIIISV